MALLMRKGSTLIINLPLMNPFIAVKLEFFKITYVHSGSKITAEFYTDMALLLLNLQKNETNITQ
jgi:hypothetical protein